MFPLKCAIIGLGEMGRHHFRAISSMAGAQVVAILDQDASRAELFPETPFFTSMAEAVSQEVEAAIVSVPTGLHEAVAIECAKYGLPTLVEKPLALTKESASRIAEVFNSENLLGAVGHVERFNPAVVKAKEVLATGSLGRVLQVSTIRESPAPNRHIPGGAFKDLAPHDIDLTLFLTGANYESVLALDQRDRAGETVIFEGIARLDSGPIVRHSVSWRSPVKTRSTKILCERGALILDTLSGDLYLQKLPTALVSWSGLESIRGTSEGEITKLAFPKSEPLVAQLESFFASVRGQPSTNLATMEDGLRVVEVMEDFDFSLRESE